MERLSIIYIFSLFFFFFFQFNLLQCYGDELSKIEISEKCELDGICENVENYPIDLVNELINKLQNEDTIFNYDEAPLPRINSRFYSGEEELLSLCETKAKDLAPQLARDMTGNWRIILNDPEKPVQVFRTQLCRESSLPCSDKINFGLGFDGECAQKRTWRQMYYLNETNKIAGITLFPVPTCCSCVLVRKDKIK